MSYPCGKGWAGLPISVIEWLLVNGEGAVAMKKALRIAASLSKLLKTYNKLTSPSPPSHTPSIDHPNPLRQPPSAPDL
jgi:hypothetical protein